MIQELSAEGTGNTLWVHERGEADGRIKDYTGFWLGQVNVMKTDFRGKMSLGLDILSLFVQQLSQL